MLSNVPNNAGPKPASALIKDGSDAEFMADVIEASREVPVIVDFWAPWCGPCKTLGPLLEKAVTAAKGAVKMVKIDTDKHPAVAGQLRVQSIPTVYAFFQGRPVDGFQGALPESQIKQFVERLAKLGGGDGGIDIAAILEEAKALLDAGNAQEAAAVYNEVLGEEPENAAAYAGLIRCLLAVEQAEGAQEMLDNAPAAIAKSPELAAIRTQLELARQAAEAGPLGDLKAAVDRDPADHQARYDYALALYAAGRNEEAVEALLEIVRRDREWNERAARTQLLKLFEAFGPTDKLTVMARRKLSSILFA
ncbi:MULTISPECIES: co-chaperone YbbN [Azospirillaceae]|uniref:thioredoxin family protein n=1 Tax=Azospirillaceae TaxID=2829815 RepID=UPI000B712D44|nr:MULTISPECIES: co-chaperone YbbN [Azospirillaceae]MDG5497694.1 co-chaperone YbbN [Niveispirillum sp. BGYR6]SNS58875.1 thioredoxin [Azospirillum sp. RU38E]SNS78599.1 thioredoxin [Azospirillum sp. RU37A]